MSQFEDFDPTAGGQTPASDRIEEGEFEEFDVQAEAESEADVTIEALGGLSDSEDHVRSLLAARDELESRLMGPAILAVSATGSDAEPYTPNNVVGVGIGEKLVNGVP